MHGTGNENLDVSDERIKELLKSDDPNERDQGLVLLDWNKREKFFGVIRKRSNQRRWFLGGEDIAEIWEAILFSIAKKVEKREFTETGNLDGYIRMIAEFRSVDFLRRRVLIDHNVEVERLWRFDEPHARADPRVIRKIRAWFNKLSTTERLVMTHFLRLYFEGRGAKWPSLRETRDSVNRGNKNPLTLQAVASALARARKKLEHGFKEEEGGLQ